MGQLTWTSLEGSGEALLADDERRQSMSGACRAWAEGFSIRASFEHFWATHEAALAESG